MGLDRKRKLIRSLKFVRAISFGMIMHFERDTLKMQESAYGYPNK